MNGCSFIYHDDKVMATHKEQCHLANPSPPPPSQERPEYAIAFRVYLSEFASELEQRISNGATPGDMNRLVMSWLAEAKPAPEGAHDSA